MRSGHPDPDKFSLLTASGDGSDEKTLVSGMMSEMPNYLAWTPDGKSIAAVTYEGGDYLSEIVEFDVASGKSARVSGYKDNALAYLTWLRSGDGMLFTSESRGSGFMRHQIGYIEAGQPDIRFVTQDTNNYSVLRLSSDGKTLSAIQYKSIYSFFDFPAFGMAPGTTTPAGLREDRDIYGFGWAPENALYVTDGGKLIRASTNGRDETSLFGEADTVIAQPASCAGGRYIVFNWAGYHGSRYANIWRVDADGHDPKQLTNERFELNPVCPPDGKWVYFRNFFSHDIERVPTEGGKTELVPGTRIPGGQLDTTPISISPDGVWLAFLVHVEPTGNETAHQTKVVLLNLELADKSADAATIVKRIVSPDQRISGAAQCALVVDALLTTTGAQRYGFFTVAAHPHESHKDPNAPHEKPAAVPGRVITNFTSDRIDCFAWSLDGKQLGVLQKHVVSDVVLLRDTSK